MEEIFGYTIAALVGVIAFFAGSILSPHARAYRIEARTWQGNYSGLKKQMVEVQKTMEETDPLVQVASSFGIDPKIVKLARPYIEQWINQKSKELMAPKEKGQPSLEEWR